MLGIDLPFLGQVQRLFSDELSRLPIAGDAAIDWLCRNPNKEETG